VTAENLELMRLIDRQYTARPFCGSRRMAAWLRTQGHAVNRRRVQRLLGVRGLEAIHPRPRRRGDGRPHRVFPSPLRGVAIERADQVGSADIPYVPLPTGFMYLAATIDWFSRYVVAWRLSNTLDGAFCCDRLDAALAAGAPEVFNTDQGVQFTAEAFTGRRESARAAVSRDGRGRAADNVFVERLWRTVKYEDVYLRGYEAVPELERGLAAYFAFYNHERLHQSLGYRTPAEVYGGKKRAGEE
jgi:putative transposase